VCLACALVIFGCRAREAATPPDSSAADAAALDKLLKGPAPAFVDEGDEGGHLWQAVRRFYKRRGGRPAWFRDREPRDEVEELRAAVAKASLEGLDAADYEPGDSRAGSGPDTTALAELRLTYVFIKYASHLLTGRVDPRELDANWVGQPRRRETPDVLDAALSGEGIAKALERLAPRHPQYAALKRGLQGHRERAEKGGWPTDLPKDLRLKEGDRAPGVKHLRARLKASGDLDAKTPLGLLATLDPDSEHFNDGLVEALTNFQTRHGLEPTGILDAKTVAALNVTLDDRICQIELNLERWRWLPEELGNRYVMVNIPAFRLEALENDGLALEMRVAVGKKDHPTPIFSEPMTEVVFSPYWNIPAQIAREEWIPEVVRDPDYLRDNGLEIIKGDRVVSSSEVDWSDSDLRLRQRPGAANVLGLVKFAFPNRFNVYLHDTPEDAMFHRASRDLSHGCVRVEKPEELAAWVLRGRREWTRAHIEKAMHAGVEQRVGVEPPIPVYLVYQTAWAQADGTVSFSEDIYGHDAAQVGLLEDRPDRRRRTGGSGGR
jgi:L,D-transpeptidase YcbB